MRDASGASVDSGCVYVPRGCTDPSAPNYFAEAEVDDGTCIVSLLHRRSPSLLFTGDYRYDFSTGDRRYYFLQAIATAISALPSSRGTELTRGDLQQKLNDEWREGNQ